MLTRFKLKLAAIVVLAASHLSLLGCNDPYSQHRIARRWESFNETATDIEKREKDSIRRTDDDLKSLRHWWIQDCKRWEERAPTVGDYIW